MDIWFGRLAALAFLACALAGQARPAMAGDVDLFVAATPADTSAAPQPGPKSAGAARERLVALNAAALAGPPAAPDARGVAAKPGKIRITLFSGVAAAFDVTKTEPAYGGGSIVTATAGADGSATLVLVDGGLTGRVTLKGRNYRVSRVNGRLHRVAELSRGLLPPTGPHVTPPSRPRAAAAPAPAAAPADGVTEVTILFAYTKRAKAKSSDILAEINLAVSMSNSAYEASGVDMRMKLVGSVLVKNFDERTVNYERILEDLTGTGRGASVFAATRAKRDQTGADLVALIREGGEYCGLGWINSPPTQADADYGFSVSTRDCIAFDVVAHETGHNMGLNHDRFVEGKAPKAEYNFGYVNVKKRVFDIMAYPDKCDNVGVDCEQQTKFSSPDLTVAGQPFGVPEGKAGAADAARWLNENRAGVASFRPDPAAARVAEAADASEARAPEIAAARGPESPSGSD